MAWALFGRRGRTTENLKEYIPIVHGAIGCGQESIKCHQLLFGFLARNHLPRVLMSVTSVTNDKDYQILKEEDLVIHFKSSPVTN
jgi:hypothetical protein